MKQKDLIQKLENAGFKLLRHGNNHDVYARGNDREVVPRHTEIKEMMAKAIIRRWGL